MLFHLSCTDFPFQFEKKLFLTNNFIHISFNVHMMISFFYIISTLLFLLFVKLHSYVNSQGHNFYKLKYISLEEVKIVPFQQ